MALITFPVAEKGSITSLLANVRYNSINVVVDNNVIPIQGALTGSPGEADDLERLVNGFETAEFHWSGIVEVGGSQGLAESSTMTHGTVLMHTGTWSVARSWPLVDVTGCNNSGTGDTQKRWFPAIGSLFGSYTGYIIASGPSFTTVSDKVALASQTLTIKNHLVDGALGLTGTAHIKTVRLGNPLIRGGPIPVSMNYTYTTGWTFDATGNGANFSAIFDETVTQAVRATGMAIDLDTGQTITSIDAYLRYLAFSVPFNRGGPIGVQGIYRVDHP